MTTGQILCVDIGSTYTKGAVFRLAEDRFVVERRAVTATTVDFLPDGFYNVAKQLCPDTDWHGLTAADAPHPNNANAQLIPNRFVEF